MFRIMGSVLVSILDMDEKINLFLQFILADLSQLFQ
jgi:hypothetical protein